MIELRAYQEDAVEAIYDHLRHRDDNPCVVIPTGAGKTPVMATVCRDAVGRWKGRVLILAHVRELLEQAVEKLRLVAPEMRAKIGVYSAGLRRRDTGEPIIVAGIQSVYRRACELDAFDLVIIDEAHMIPAEGDGRYRTFLAEARAVNPNLRVVGLTATPFRLKSGMICGPEHVLNHICYDVGVKELIERGYLSPLVTRAGCEVIDTSALRVRAGEFVAGETERLMDTDERVISACQEIVTETRLRRSVLVFASGVAHADHVAEVLRRTSGEDVGVVVGETPGEERGRLLTAFKAGTLRYLVNVNVLTTGFDAPNIDCVAIVRPTLSPGLYYQMVGRGFRLHAGKENCLVLDFGGNVARHGPVDAIRIEEKTRRAGHEAPLKQCPECEREVAAGCGTCPNCGHAFPPPSRREHDATATSEDIISGHVTIMRHLVQRTCYAEHQKRGAPEDAPRTLRVDYQVGLTEIHSEWICFEHDGYVRARAERWWRRRSHAPVPSFAAEAEVLARAGALCETTAIKVRHTAGEAFDTILGYALGPKPTWREPGWDHDDGTDAALVGALGAGGDHDVPF